MTVTSGEKRLADVGEPHGWARADMGAGPNDAPMIFVSHSTRDDDAESHAALALIQRELTATGYMPIIDHNELRVSEPFDERLRDIVMRSHGMIVVVSHSALCSDWVRREVDMVMGRRITAEPSLPIIPLLLSDVRISDLQRSALAKTGLDQLQVGWLKEPDRLPPDVLGVLEPLLIKYGRRPLRDLEDCVSHRLKQAAPRAKQKAAAQLGLATAPYQERDLDSLLAQRLLAATYDQVRLALRELHGRLDDDSIHEIIDMIVPFALVPEESAYCITTARCSVPRSIAALGATRTRTAQIYLRRSCPEPVMWDTYVPVLRGGSHDYSAALEKDIRRHLLRKLALDDASSDRDLASALDIWGDLRGPIVVIISLPPDRQLIDNLLRSFPTVFFFFVTSAASDADPQKVVWVKPVLPDEPKLLQKFDILINAFVSSPERLAYR